VRKECPEIGWGDWTIVRTGAPATLAMRYDWRGTAVVVVHNFGEHAAEARLRLGDDAGHLVDLFTDATSDADDRGVHRLPLDAYESRWFRVGGANYALRRER
jgi:maltose alpha-D-glucosyltransferase/alpha-amylase